MKSHKVNDHKVVKELFGDFMNRTMNLPPDVGIKFNAYSMWFEFTTENEQDEKALNDYLLGICKRLGMTIRED